MGKLVFLTDDIYYLRNHLKKRTQKEYAEFLGVSLRTVQNWESRGAGETALKLLCKIDDLEIEIDRLQKIIQDQNKTFVLPSEKGL